MSVTATKPLGTELRKVQPACPVHCTPGLALTPTKCGSQKHVNFMVEILVGGVSDGDGGAAFP